VNVAVASNPAPPDDPFAVKATGRGADVRFVSVSSVEKRVPPCPEAVRTTGRR
jgi:hypothetical protein